MIWLWQFFKGGNSVRIGMGRRPTIIKMLDSAERAGADHVMLKNIPPVPCNVQALYSFTRQADGEWRADLDPTTATTAIRAHATKA